MTIERTILMVTGVAALAAAAVGYGVGRVRAAGIPAAKPMSYSGVLTDPNGAPLTGTRTIQVKLITPDGAQTCASDPTPETLSAGSFSLPLPDTCTALVHANPDLFVEVLVDGTSIAKTKLGAVPYAVEAQHALQATAATGALDKRISGLEAHDVKLFRWGFVSCQPLDNFRQAGFTNVVVRAALYADAACTNGLGDSQSCHAWCSEGSLNDPSFTTGNCCAVAKYYTLGVVEILGFK
jgi:hypothetical protein